MNVSCSAHDSAEGAKALVDKLRYYSERYPDAKLVVYTDEFADTHQISVRWTEER